MSLNYNPLFFFFFYHKLGEAENIALVIKNASLARDGLSIGSLPEIKLICKTQDRLHNLWGPLFSKTSKFLIENFKMATVRWALSKVQGPVWLHRLHTHEAGLGKTVRSSNEDSDHRCKSKEGNVTAATKHSEFLIHWFIPHQESYMYLVINALNILRNFPNY